ncbi:uncharacterized protein LOC121822802 [Peromyscus maniculatus bairdii]|uniref:uncharacterized protein LOC121822802 n=1 Tax=Peromyscus maniculatus bairdii TaxID=230844 RepID=UPI003FCF3481
MPATWEVEAEGRHWRASGRRRTAHLRAEFLVIALGALVQPLGVPQQLLHLAHVPLAAPQLALQLLHLPPQLRQLRLGRGGRRRGRRGLRGGHAAVRERGAPRAPMAGGCSRRHRGSPAQGPREGAGCERRSHARPGATGPGHVAPKSATGTTSEGAKLSPPGCELGHPARGQARRSRQTGALPGRENRAEAL